MDWSAGARIGLRQPKPDLSDHGKLRCYGYTQEIETLKYFTLFKRKISDNDVEWKQ